jgi:hypothetical protein
MVDAIRRAHADGPKQAKDLLELLRSATEYDELRPSISGR